MRTPQYRRPRDERGSLPLEFALGFATFFAVVLVIIGYAVRLHSKQVVTFAAEDALAVAQRYGATAAQAQAAAEHDLAKLGGDLHNTSVTVTYNNNIATVVVSGDAPQIAPLVQLRVSTQVSAPVEQVVATPGANQ